MKIVWSALLVVGLGLIGVSVYEAQTTTASGPVMNSHEDGGGMPPTPTPKPN